MQPLPDLSRFTFGGATRLGGQEAWLWQRSIKVGDKTSQVRAAAERHGADDPHMRRRGPGKLIDGVC